MNQHQCQCLNSHGNAYYHAVNAGCSSSQVYKNTNVSYSNACAYETSNSVITTPAHYQYDQAICDTLPSSHNQWVNSSLYSHQDSHCNQEQLQQQYYDSSIYDQTPPPEVVLNNLLHQQQHHHQQQQNNNDKYLDPSNNNNFNMVNISPLSPMSIQSSESFENMPLMSPRFEDNASSSTGAAIYYVDNAQSAPPVYFQQRNQQYQQEQEQHHQHQYQLQHQYHLQQQQQHWRYANETQYDTLDSHQQGNNSPHFNEGATQQQQQKLISPEEAKPMDNSGRVRQSRKRKTGKRIALAQLQCLTCFKTFSRPYNLKSHQKTHTNERPFACLYPGCSWTFARPHDLKRHAVSLHTGIKPYGCICGKRFARSDAFKRHQAVDSLCSLGREFGNM